MNSKIIIILLFYQIATFGQVSSVNKATGSMQVSMPLHTLIEGNLSVPIALAYDASGVAVDGVASNVGINWSLVAGGSISREIRGFADENYNYQDKMGTHYGYLHTGYPTSTNFGFLKDWEPDVFSLSLNGQSIQFILKKNASNIIEPILLNDNTDISIEVKVDAQITITDPPCTANTPTFDTRLNEQLNNIAATNGLSSFVVTTTDGIKYYFGKNVNEREYVFNKNSLDSKFFALHTSENRQSTSPIVWKLSRIEYPKGTTGTQVFQAIDFNYVKRQEKIVTNSFDKAESQTTANCNDVPHSVWNFSNVNFIYRSELTSIVSDNFEVRFNESTITEPTNINSIIPDYTVGQFNDTQRKDVANITFNSPISYQCVDYTGNCSDGSNQSCWKYNNINLTNPFKDILRVKALNNVVIIDKTTNTKIGYYLYHDYFNGFSYVDQAIGYTYNDSEKLNLKGVYPIKFKSDGTTELQAGYSLQYIGNTVPSKFSLARDHWGYYNGMVSNESKKTGYSIPGVTCLDVINTNLNSSLAFAQIGSLYSVKLPTGGTESYIYELHDCFNYQGQPNNTSVGGLRIKEIHIQESVVDNEIVKKYTYKKNTSESSGYLALCPIYMVNGSTIFPTIYQSLYSRFTNRMHVTYLKVKEEVVGVKDGVESLNGYSEYEYYGDDPNSIGNIKCEWVPDGSGSIFPYTLQCVPLIPDAEPCYSSFPTNVNFAYVYSTINVYPPNMMFRGLPKSVRIYNANQQLISESVYKYTLEDLTSLKNIECGLITHMDINIENVGPIPNPIITIVSVASSAIGFAPEPNAQAISQILNALGQIFSAVNQIAGTIVDNTSYLYSLYKYKLPLYRTRPESTISRVYDLNNSTNVIETTSKMFYESNSHKQLTKSQIFRSSNFGVIPTTNAELIQETQVKYSTDYQISSAGSSEVNGILGLKNRKMLLPIETIIKRGTYVIGGTYNIFQDDPDKEGLLKSSYTLELENPVNAGSFTMSSLSSNSIIKNPNYELQQTIGDYNVRGLPTSISSPLTATVTNITYGINNYLPIQTQIGTGTKFFTRNTEYAIPMFGVSKSIGSDNMFNTISYDELGRIKDVKDQNAKYVKSYIYNERTSPVISNDVNFFFTNYISQLFQITSSSISLSNQLVGFPGLGIKAVVNGFTPESVEISINSSNLSRNLIINNPSQTFVLFNSTGGFEPIQGTTYTIELKAFSLPDRKGDMIGYKKMNFNIIP